MNTIPFRHFRAWVLPLATLVLGSILHAAETSSEAKEATTALPAAILRKYDLDKDGVLNADEKAAWKADIQRGRAEAQAKKLEKYDANHDGVLDKDERATAKADASKKKSETSPKKSEAKTKADAVSTSVETSSAKPAKKPKSAIDTSSNGDPSRT